MSICTIMGETQEIECDPTIDELINLILTNPFFKRVGDEIGARALMKWTNQHWHYDPLERKDESKILDAIKKLHHEGIISHKTVDNRVYLMANAEFFELKQKKSQSRLNRINANLTLDYSPTMKDDSPVSNKKTSFVQEYDSGHNFQYYDVLIQNIRNYQGPNKKLQMNCPIFFKLLCDIINDTFTDWHTKMMISSAIAYFVLEEDVIKDDEENGYIDDLFITAFVLKEIKKCSPELIDENWLYEEDIFELIEDVFNQSSLILGDKTYEVLRKVGLHKFHSLDLEDYSGEYPQRLSKIASEKRELLGIAAFLINKLHNTKMKITTLEQIKGILQESGESGEIIRLMELAKIHHSYTIKTSESEDFEKNLERRLQEARLIALLER